MNNVNYSGWDIGGAHLKVASINTHGELLYVHQYATPLWQGLDCLEQVFPLAMAAIPQPTARHAVTMTAELVDIFPSRHEGIKLLNRLCQRHLGDKFDLYAREHGFLYTENQDKAELNIASANWHASGELVARLIPGGLFIDIGSTTTDIIPVSDNKLRCKGYDDQTRLQHDELVYTGVVRTSLMALAQRVPVAGQWQGIAAEHFATTADIYRILGLLDENADLMPTADGAGKDRDSSIRRLARMVGTDADTYPDPAVWQQLAAFFAEAQMQQLSRAVQAILTRLPELDKIIVAAGAGRFLIKSLAERLSFKYLEFSDLIDCKAGLAADCNTCAPAVAVAQLNRMRQAA